MAASFDPYREWLGLSEPRSAINHYRLFRLKLFEADPSAIAAAADATISRIREINTESATLGDLQARLLADLTAARRCLLDPPSRAKYDERLRARLADPNAPVPMAIPVGTVPSARGATDAPTGIHESLWQEPSDAPRRLQHAPRTSYSQASGLALLVLLAGGIGLAVWQMGPSEAPPEPIVLNLPVENTAAEASTSRGPAAEPVPSAEAPSKAPNDVPEPTLPQLPLSAAAEAPSPAVSVPAPAPSESSPATTATFRRAVNQARAALVGRDVKRAMDQLALARRSASTPQQRDEVNRLAALASQLERFFDIVRAGLRRLEPTDEIRIGEWVAVVVASGPEGLALFDEGSRRDYTLTTLPAKVALFAAQAGADEKSPQTKVATGAFQAVDADGDRDAARRLWNEAAAAGQQVDDLLPFLDSAALEVSRDPVPEPQLATAADQRVEQEFSAAIEAAKSAAQKSELAVKLMAAAHDAESPVDQYALVKRAGQLATAAADARLSLQADEELTRWFDVDRLALVAATLSALDNQRPTATTAKYIARRALELADEAKSEKRTELAKSLADTALAAARKARDPELVKRVTERRRELSTRAGAAKKSRKSASGE